MAVNPYGLYQTPYEEPQGDKAATPETFVPEYSKDALKRIIKSYKTNPKIFNEQQVDKIKKHAIYHNVGFYSGDFSLGDALKQFSGGLLEGFTTFNTVDPPDNEYEAIARNVGHLLGFAPNMMAKPLKLLGLSRAANVLGTFRSVPLGVGEYATKKAAKVLGPVMKTAIGGRADATGVVAKFLTSGATKHVAEEGFKLGVASAVSNWQHGVDAMIEGGIGGAKFGAAFGVLGNMVPGKGKASYALRATAGSIFQGLPATQRGATTPEQVYEYLLGAYFGGGASGWKQKGAAEFFVKKEKQAYGADGKKGDPKLRATNDPELVKGWNELDPEIQKQVKAEMLDPNFNGKGKASIHYDEKTVEMGGFQARTAMQEMLMTGMGIEPNKTIKSKKAWEKFESMTQEPVEQKRIGLASQTEKEFSEIFERRKTVIDDLTKRKNNLDKLEGSERVLEEDNIKKLEGELADLNSREKELLTLEPYQYIEKETRDIKTEPRANDGNDIGMSSGMDLLRKSEIIVTEKMESIWNKEEYSPITKRNEIVRLTNLVDNIVRQDKYLKKNQRVEVDELVKELEDRVKTEENTKITIDEATKDNLRQWLTRKNFGQPVRYLNVKGGKKGEIGWVKGQEDIEIRGEDGFTYAGNRKESVEPKKAIQERYEELTGKEEDPHVVLDNITIRGDKGEFKDLTLSQYRKNLMRKDEDAGKKNYEKFIKKMHKKMAEQDMYAFGGKGDNDIIIYVKKHPNMKKSGEKTMVNTWLKSFLTEGKNRKYYNEAIKRNKYFTKTEAEDQYLSNIMWDLSLNGFKPKNYIEYNNALNKLFRGKGYIKNATAWNKRQQIWFTPTWKADAKFVRDSYDAYLTSLVKKLKGTSKIPYEFISATNEGKARYIIAKDLDKALFDVTGKRIKPLDKNSKNTEYGEHVDGMILVEDGYLRTLIKDSGMPGDGQSKSFIVSPDATNGALLGKYMMHSVGKDASKAMREAGVHMIMQESAVKQRGERELTDYSYKNGKVTIDDPNLVYEMPVENIKYGYNVKQTNAMAGYNPDGSVHKHGIPKQLLMSMAQNTFKSFPIKMVEDFFNETVYKKFNGEKKYNKVFEEYLDNPESKTLLRILEKNVDKLGIDKLLQAINDKPTEFTDAAYMRLMKLNKESIAERVAEGEITPDEADRILSNINEFNSATDRIVEAANKWSQKEKLLGNPGNINPVLLHKYIRPYRFQVIRNYVFNSISKPKIGNSGVARMRGYDKFLQADPKFDILNTRDDVFFLDNSYRKMPIKTHLEGKWKESTLEEFWNAYSKEGGELYKNKDVKKILRALTVRVPMDSVSGAQALEFAGFTGREGHGILMHSRAMRAEGGADLDGDEAFIFFGGRKGARGSGFKSEWTEQFHKNKDEYLAKDGTIPDRKKGFVPGTKMTYEEYLTTQDSNKKTGIDPESRDSKIWQYDSMWRQDISERAVDGRNLLGGTVSMAQVLKSAHNSIASLPKGINEYTVWKTNYKTKKKYPVKVTIQAKTSEKELAEARQLASSMTAFTSDPLDVAGLTGYTDYFNKLSKAYFNIKIDGMKASQKEMVDLLRERNVVNKNGIIGQMIDINSALFSRDYQNNKSWDAQSIKQKTMYTKNVDGLGLEKIRNTMLPKLGKLANSVDLHDSPFRNMNTENLVKMYAEHNNIINKFPEMRELLGNLKVPFNPIVKAIMNPEKPEFALWKKHNLDSVAADIKKFNRVMSSKGSPFAKGKGWYSEISGKNLNKTKNEEYRREKLQKLLKFAEDIITQDVSDMVSFRQLYRYYDGVEVNKNLFDKILKDVSYLRRNSYLQRKSIGEEEAISEVAGMKMPKSGEGAVRDLFGNLRVEGKERSTTLDQAKVDAEIAKIKATLPNARAQKIFDMLMLGTFRDGTTETSISKLGLSSKNVDSESVVDFIGDYSTVMNRAYDKVPIDDAFIKNINKGNMSEKDLPEKTILEDTTTGYEGLHGKLTSQDFKRLPRNVRQELTELVENLKFYNGKIGQNLNEIVRGVLEKDFNALTYKDFVDLNSYFKEIQRGSIWQRLFGDKKRAPIDKSSFEGKENVSGMKAPLLQKRYSYLFPLSIGRETMRYDIELLKKRGLFITKAGEVARGDIQIPTNFTEKLQHAVTLSMDKAQGKGDEEVGKLRTKLEFIDSLEDGEALRRVAVRKLEAEGNVSENLSGDKVLGKQFAANYLKEYHNEMETSNYNTLKDNKYRVNKIVDGEVTRVELTGEQIVNQIESTYTNHFKEMYKIISGKPEILDSYHKRYKGKKMYFDFLEGENAQEPIYRYKKFVRDIYKSYERGEDITTDFGIDGLRAIARSMMVQLQHTHKKMSKGELRKLVPVPKPTQAISKGYWPHMFFDKGIATKALKQAVEKIEASNLSRSEKDLEIDKIQWRTKTLTGDWITGTENWDAYEHYTNPSVMKTQKKSDKVSWFQANQMTGSMHQRTSHIPGHSIDATVAETYSRNIYRTYFKQLSQILSRDILQEFDNQALRKGWHMTEFDPKTGRSLKDRWSDHYKLYVQDAMGHPSIIPDYMINDPGMKLKGTPYAWWADNKVRDRVNSIAKKIGIKEDIPGKEKYSVQDVSRWSNLEAKYELMSLLAHPKSMINNLFGGSLHTVQSVGATALRKVYDYNFLRTINPEWTNKQAIMDFVIKQGVFPEMLQNEWGLQKELQSAKSKEFLKDVGRKLNKKGEMDKTTLREIASKHKIAAPVLQAAAKFMSVPEMQLRKDAFMSHYIKAWERFGGAITQFDDPFLIEMAKKGVKATQFLYSAPYRPGFARTALGKVMTRFQLWSWNSARFRNDVIREARIRGYRAGTPEYEKFKRTAQIDLLTYALGSVFAMSLFENILPAPLNHFKETSEWLFGDEKIRNQAFFSAYPTKIAPLQMITPPVARLPLSILRTLTDDNYDKFLQYHIYTMFPFGRIARDFSPWARGNVLDSPYRAVEKFTGIPYGDIQRKRREFKENIPYHPTYRKAKD